MSYYSRFLGIIIVVLITFIFRVISSNKRKKERNKAVEYNKSIKEIECEIIDVADDLSTKITLSFNYSAVFDVLIFEDHIAFITGCVIGSYQPEIEIKDINFVRMKNIFQTDLLLINHNAKYKDESKSKEKYPPQFYLKGSKEDLLYIKNFIEEKMNRPKIIDLTGRDQMEQ